MKTETLILYHTGYYIIEEPDIHHGRKNADFGQGFYLSDNYEFAHRWGRDFKGREVFVNRYEMDLSGLKIRKLERNEEWYDYIFSNRRGKKDYLKEYDLIIGPIANDTIYDTMGVFTSGLLSREESLRMLLLGRRYVQYALKSEKAKNNLKWLDAVRMTEKEIKESALWLKQEQKQYQLLIAEAVEQ